MEDTLKMELPDSLLTPAWRNLCRTTVQAACRMRMTRVNPQLPDSSKQAMLDASKELVDRDGIINLTGV